MRVKITETGKIESLNIYTSDGIDWTFDFIGNLGALDDGQFIQNENEYCWECNQETFDWWRGHIKNYDTMQGMITEIEENGKLTSGQILEALTHYYDNDEENGPFAVMKSLNAMLEGE